MRSENRLDEQFCVSTRLAVSWINAIIKAARMEDAPWALSLDSVSYDAVNKMFMDFEKFKGRPDFRNHMRVWFMGESLDSLPEVEGLKDAVSDIGHEAGEEERAGGGGEGQEDPVPVRGQDATETGS